MRNAPGSCLSNPMAMPMSAAPDSIVFTAWASAVPPVAQPLTTLVNGRPVRPTRLTMVSAAPPSIDPPTANCMSDHC